MKSASRILVFLISLTLVVSYFVPLWSIQLEAPQYPEGLGMNIWLNKFSGDLSTINGLNHYIGMKQIHEDTFPELQMMPILVGFLIGLGVVVALVRKKWLLAVWVSIYIALGIVGCVDFYNWEYDYGHDLNPHAAIKVPGMSYQPPLIGSKQLLNFVAHSYPDHGGWVIILCGAAAFLVMLYELFVHKKKNIAANASTIEFPTTIASACAMLFLLMSACAAPKPEPIHYGTDACSNCKMTISDPKFGAEIVSKTGKVFKFDSGECLVSFINGKKIDVAKIESLLVTDMNTKEFCDAATSTFIVSTEIQSPMGANLGAFKEKSTADQFLSGHSGTKLEWGETLKYFSKEK